MSIQFLFLISIWARILSILIVYRRFYILKSLRIFAKKTRIEKEKQSLKELEEKNTIKEKVSDKKVEKFSPTSTMKIKLKKAEMLISYWEFEEATKLLTFLLSENEDYFEVNNLLWKISLKELNYEKAEIFFTKCLSLNSWNIDTLVNIWICFFKLWKYKEAIEDFEYLLKLWAKKSIVFSNLWKSYFAVNDLVKSEKAFLKAIQIEPRNIEILFMLAEIHIENKKYEKAKDIYKKILNIEPYNQEASNYILKLESKK